MNMLMLPSTYNMQQGLRVYVTALLSFSALSGRLEETVSSVVGCRAGQSERDILSSFVAGRGLESESETAARRRDPLPPLLLRRRRGGCLFVSDYEPAGLSAGGIQTPAAAPVRCSNRL